MMFLNNLSFLERTKLNLISKIFPVKKPELILMDQLEITLKEAKINQIKIPSISLPQVSFNFCPVRPEITGLKTFHENQIVEDLTIWLREQLSYPEIESFSTLLDMPRKAGKSYQQTETQERQATLFEGDTDCIHGLKKTWCSICIEKERQNREMASRRVDPFDLIFPILQPPLGENFDSPIAFQSGMELYPFQRVGVKFLADHERALLGDEMGLGKSIQAIVAIRFLLRMGKVTNGLILCPKSVLTDWEKKLWDWAPEIRAVKVRGPKEQRQISWNSPAHIYLTTYETLRQDLDSSKNTVNSDGSHTINCPNDVCSQRLHIENELFGKQLVCPTCKHEFIYSPVEDIARKEFDLIILDEIQKIKNPGASTTKATRIVDARFRWGLSGTPLENRLEELISIFAYLKPGLLHYDDASRPQKVKESIEPYFLRRKVEALPEFPKVAHDDVWLELSPTQRESYDRAEQEGVVAINEQGDSVTVQHILALITKLKQICNIDPVSKESCKLEYLLDKLEEISDLGDKSLVFSQYPEKTLRFLEPELLQFSPSVYRGALSDSQRDKIVDEFQNQEACKVLLMSLKAGGLGITLTRANHVFHFDQWWNPAVTDQATARARRIGQKKTVFVTSLFTVDTIEEKIQDLLKRKRELFKAVIDDLSDTNLSKVLTEEELFSLFNLQKAKPTISKGTPRDKFTIESLGQISPQQFERLITNLYEKMGYQVKLTPQTRDQGIDIYAKRVSESGTESLAIQCKHYPNGTVGVEHARSLYGVIQDQPSITRGVLITTGSFSRECKEFTKGKRLELFNVNYVCGLLEKYGISFSEITR
jgi:superfamily II DNA or RNA helicase